MDTFGSRLKALLKRAKVSQALLAEKTKIPLRTISSYANDDIEPGIEKVKAIAGVLHADLNRLVFGVKYNPDFEEPVKPWRVSDGAEEYAVSADAVYKRLRIILLFTSEERFKEIMKDTPADFGIKLNALNTLIEVAREDGFKEDIFWLLTGHTLEQWRETILGEEMSKLTKKLENLPKDKLKLVKDLIDNLK